VIGRITMPRHGPPDEGDDRGIGLLCRRLLISSASTIHLSAPSHGQAEQLAGSMTEVFGRMRAGRRFQKRSGGPGGNDVPSVPKVLAPEGIDAWISDPDDELYTVLLAPEGISTRKLRLFAEGHDSGALTGVVVVRTRRGRRVKLPVKS
jgi:hypothetical protein